jgi:hypothetical protein
MGHETARRRSERGAGLSCAVIFAVMITITGCKQDQRVASITDSARAARDSVVRDSTARARQDSINRAQPGYIIDSIFPPEEELRRFRKAIGGDSAKRFTGGSTSKDALVRRFIEALVKRDTNDLRAMAVHAREYADLIYLGSPNSHPPYHQPPDFAWRQMQDPSTAGLTKLMHVVAGKPMQFIAAPCEPKVLHEGKVTRYTGCLVRFVNAAGDTVTKRYFGSIVERDGQFKFLSYTNDI